MDVALFLLQHRADVNARDNGDETPLHLASRHGDANVVRLLIAYGTDPNAENKMKETPLSLASENGRLEAARLLLKHGADVNHRDEGSSSHFQYGYIFDAALTQYKRTTKVDLLAHPLTAQLQTCGSPSAIFAMLNQIYVLRFYRSPSGDNRSRQLFNTTVNVLYPLSEALNEGIGLVFSPANVVFAGVGIYLMAARDIAAAEDVSLNLFWRIEFFMERLHTYIGVPPTVAMTDLMVIMMAEVLRTLAIATKWTKLGRGKRFIMRLMGRTDVEDAVKRLDKLTQEVAWMAIAQVPKIAHNVNDKVEGTLV
ncbi:hypothetical protein BJV78DRAFT_1181203 [Lactifluus subvellereus]|nr:hypothetical protein BJV78DRAFT_1181203 [Lactifluus subvellereus]